MKIQIIGLLLLSLNAVAQISEPKPHYKIAQKISLEGDSGWDYLTADEATNRLFVSHGNIVQVVDLNTGKTIGTINGMRGVHGIALANDLNKGFISAGKDTAVTVFDLKTFAVIAKIKVTGNNPDAIVFDNVTQRVFTFNGRGRNSTVIDAKKNKVVGTIPLIGKPEFSVADGTGKLFVNIEDKDSICEIDAQSMKVVNTWSIAPGDGPSGLAMDTKNRRLFSVCDNKMMVVSDADNGKVVTTLPIGDGPDAAAYDPEMMRVYSSNGSEGNLTVVSDSAGTYKVLENVQTQHRARTMAVNTKTHHIYLSVARFSPLLPHRAGITPPKPHILPGTFVVLDVVPVE